MVIPFGMRLQNLRPQHSKPLPKEKYASDMALFCFVRGKWLFMQHTSLPAHPE